jgi:transcriptional regulator with XRE-family HTH domain
MEYLISLRKKNRLTQAELGEKTGIDGNTISRYERNAIKPSIDALQRLSDYFKVSVDELLNGPREEGYKVTLRFVKNIEEAQSEMMINGCGAVSLADDGTVIASHMGKLTSREDKAQILAAIDEKLEEALETINRRAAKKQNSEK